jgi:hypothetical protein
MDPVEMDQKIRDEETAVVPPPPSPPAIGETMDEPERRAPVLTNTEAMLRAEGAPPAGDREKPSPVVLSDAQVAPAPPATLPTEAPAPARPTLTELQMLKIELLKERHRTAKARSLLAQNMAEQAAMAEAATHDAVYREYAEYGVDVDRQFKVDEKGRVTYPIAGKPPMPDYAPPPGKKDVKA